jgi:hypothetical protein
MCEIKKTKNPISIPTEKPSEKMNNEPTSNSARSVTPVGGVGAMSSLAAAAAALSILSHEVV